MSVILSIPVLGFLTIIQSAVISRLPLNRGTADLVLVVIVAIALQKTVTVSWQWSLVGGLFVDFFSGLPFGIFTASYLIATGLALILRDRIWRFSFLMQLLVVLFGSVMGSPTWSCFYRVPVYHLLQSFRLLLYQASY